MANLLPVYYEIKHVIKNWILNKEFSLGQKIPSENELAHRFSVNRLTVRQAISQLIQEGFLFARRGEGTFVTHDENLVRSFNIELMGFMDESFYQVCKTKAKSVKIETFAPPKVIREKLELDDSCGDVIQIKRARLLDDKPFAYTINYLPKELGSGIREDDLYRRPVHQILREEYGIEFTEAVQSIEASFATREVSEELGVSQGLPILLVERIMFGKKRRPVQLVQSSYRGDLYKYIVRLKNIRKRDGRFWIHAGDQQTSDPRVPER
jgi:GntR family transcriptional regulator